MMIFTSLLVIVVLLYIQLCQSFHLIRLNNRLPIRHSKVFASTPTVSTSTTSPTSKLLGKGKKKSVGYQQLPDLSQSSFPEAPSKGYYDLVVIGSGPGGENCAIRAAALGAKVAVIEKKSTFGGPTGLSSKAVREATKKICSAVDSIGGDRRRQIKGLWRRLFPVLKTEAEVLQASESRERLKKNGVDLYIGAAELIAKDTSLVDLNQLVHGEGEGERAGESWDDSDKEAASIIRVCRPTGCVELISSNVVIATGSRPYKPSQLKTGVQIPFEKGRVVCADEISNILNVPNAACILGGGVIAVEYATVLSELGAGVTLVTPEESFLPFLEKELRSSLRARMKNRGHVLFVEEPLKEITLLSQNDASSSSSRISSSSSSSSSSSNTGDAGKVKVVLAKSQKRKGLQQERSLKVDIVLFSGGRFANSESLGCENVGIQTGQYGRLVTDANQKTTAKESVYAVGDVIGSGLASAAAQQGRGVADFLFLKHTHTHSKAAGSGVAQKKIEEEKGEVAMEEYEDDIDFTTEEDDFFLPTTSAKSQSNSGDKNDGDQATLFGTATYINSNANGNGNGNSNDNRSGNDAVLDAPLTLWTIPEVASVGRSYDDAVRLAAAAGEDEGSIVQGYAFFNETARGRLSGDRDGYLKIVARIEHTHSTSSSNNNNNNNKYDRSIGSSYNSNSNIGSGNNSNDGKKHIIIGVHIIGDGANELIQLGSVLIHSHATCEQVSHTPFAAVTMSALFQIACDDALMKTMMITRKSQSSSLPLPLSPPPSPASASTHKHK